MPAVFKGCRVANVCNDGFAPPATEVPDFPVSC